MEGCHIVGSGMFKKTQTELNAAKTSSSFRLPTGHKTHNSPSPSLLRRSAGRRRRSGSEQHATGFVPQRLQNQTKHLFTYVRRGPLYFAKGITVVLYACYARVMCACMSVLCLPSASIAGLLRPAPRPHSDRPSIRKYRRLSIVYARSRGS